VTWNGRLMCLSAWNNATIRIMRREIDANLKSTVDEGRGIKSYILERNIPDGGQ
jgi:hypothetical protein